MLLFRVAAEIGERQDDNGQSRRGGFLGRWGQGGLRLRGVADFERIDPDRLCDVLELSRAEVTDLEIEPPLHLTIGVLREADRAGLGDALQPCGDIHAIAHQVAVAFLDDVAQMNADAELDAPILRHAGVALDHAGLQLDRAPHRVNDAPKFGKESVAGALNDAPLVNGDGGVDQFARAARAAAPAFPPRPPRRAGCSRRRRRSGSQRSFGFRSSGPLSHLRV